MFKDFERFPGKKGKEVGSGSEHSSGSPRHLHVLDATVTNMEKFVDPAAAALATSRQIEIEDANDDCREKAFDGAILVLSALVAVRILDELDSSRIDLTPEMFND